MESLPNDIIIVICEYIGDYICDDCIGCKDIKTLLLTSKKFKFLSEYKYLLKNEGLYDTTFTCVNYLGIQNGPQYMTIDKQYSGYIESYDRITNKQIHVVMNRSNEGYYVIGNKVYDFECTSNINDDIYVNICNKIYENFDDNEILDFIWKNNFDKKKIIRKQFFVIKYQISQINLIVASNDNQIFALDKYSLPSNTKNLSNRDMY